MIIHGGVAQLARALEWHSRGSEFKSHHLQFFFILFFIFLNYFAFSNSDETKISSIELGNKWYSKQIFNLSIFFESGFSGTKDYLKENFLFKYSFKSQNHHQFSIRFFHTGYSTGIYSNNFVFYNFSILSGFEYLFKIFNNLSGIYLWIDIGGCDKGVAFNTGIGIGDQYKTFIHFELNFMQEISLFSLLSFNFLIFDFFNIGGKIGIDLGYSDSIITFFNFKNGIFIGVTIKNVFKIEIGGGFTINDYFFFSGFGGTSFVLIL